MPLPQSSRTSCRNTDSRARASRSVEQAQGAEGKPHSFALADWPPAFKSRTGTPGDACYIGPTAKPTPPRPEQRPGGAEMTTARCVVRYGTRSWALWCLLVKRAQPMTAQQIAEHLDCTAKDVSGTAKRLVDAQALSCRRQGPRSHASVYELGPTRVVEA